MVRGFRLALGFFILLGGSTGCYPHSQSRATVRPPSAAARDPIVAGAWESLGEVELTVLPRHPSVVRSGSDYVLAFGVETASPGSHRGQVLRLSRGIWHRLGSEMPGTCSSLAVHEGSLYLVHDSQTLRRWTGSDWVDVGGEGQAAPSGSWLAPASLTFLKMPAT